MKVFIDTNIFLDILCNREQFVDDALSIFDMAVDGRIELLISDLSIANIKYITRKEIPSDKFYDLIQTFRSVFTIVPLGAGVVDNAVSLRANDFEDALQSRFTTFFVDSDGTVLNESSLTQNRPQ